MNAKIQAIEDSIGAGLNLAANLAGAIDPALIPFIVLGRAAAFYGSLDYAKAVAAYAEITQRFPAEAQPDRSGRSPDTIEDFILPYVFLAHVAFQAAQFNPRVPTVLRNIEGEIFACVQFTFYVPRKADCGVDASLQIDYW